MGGRNGTLTHVSEFDREPREPKVDRRSFLAAAGLGVGVIAAGVVGSRIGGRSASSDGQESAPAPPLTSDVDSLFGDLARGADLGDWRIARVYGVHLGAIPVVMMAPSGKRYQIDVLRRDPNGPAGVGNTRSLSLFVANRGDGERATDEGQGLGAIRLAHALDARERAGAEPPALMTLRERHAAYPNGGLSVRL